VIEGGWFIFLLGARCITLEKPAVTCEKQIPCGDDNKKGNSKSVNAEVAEGSRRSRRKGKYRGLSTAAVKKPPPPVEMTEFIHGSG
jgi:hypothetical protein